MGSRYRAVIFDLGGVVFPSPLDQFDAYNTGAGLPPGFVRGLIRASAESGAWAAHERGELAMDAFLAALEAEARAAGHPIDATALMAAVASGFGPRPEMLDAIRAIRARGLRTAALTNNWRAEPGEGIDAALERAHLFDVVVESAVEGVRKPEPAIYELALARLGVPPAACVFLDDLGINLKPARAMGMTTIKVGDPLAALRELEGVLGFPLVGAPDASGPIRG
jgi:putative hydrolase of the HAD superfamily